MGKERQDRTKPELTFKDLQTLSQKYLDGAVQLASQLPSESPLGKSDKEHDISDRELKEVLGVSPQEVIYGKGKSISRSLIRALRNVNTLSKYGLDKAVMTIPSDQEIKRKVSMLQTTIPEEEERKAAFQLSDWIENINEANKAVSGFQRGLDGQPMAILAKRLPSLLYVVEHSDSPEARIKLDKLRKFIPKYSQAREFLGVSDKIQDLLKIKPIHATLANAAYWAEIMRYAYQMMLDADEQLEKQELHIEKVEHNLPEVSTLEQDLRRLPVLNDLTQKLISDVEDGVDTSLTVIRQSMPQQRIPRIPLEEIPKYMKPIIRGREANKDLPPVERDYRLTEKRALDAIVQHYSSFAATSREYRSRLSTHAILNNRFDLFLIGYQGVNTVLSALRFACDWGALALVEQQNRELGKSETRLIERSLRSLGTQVRDFKQKFPLLQEYAQHPEELGLQPNQDKK